MDIVVFQTISGGFILGAVALVLIGRLILSRRKVGEEALAARKLDRTRGVILIVLVLVFVVVSWVRLDR